jgi:hypothetical protein
MCEVVQSEPDPDMLDHYDFSGGIRGKYAHLFTEGSTAVILDPDVAEAFPDAMSVNQALREVLHQRGKTHAK